MFAQDAHGLIRIALPDGAAKMMNAAPLAKPVILLQGHDRVAKRAPGRCGGVHDIRQHGARLDGSELIAVTEKNHAATLRQRVEELAQERKRHHRRFVDHEQIKRKRVLPIVPEVDRVTFDSQGADG